METKLNKQDLEYIQKKGISIEKIEQQLLFFKQGVEKINLEKPALKGDGILNLSPDEKEKFIRKFDAEKEKFDIQKFIPASGAASRMFKFLSEFLSNYNPEDETINAYINRNKSSDLSIFLIGLKNFPFYTELRNTAYTIYPDYKNYDRNKRDFCLIKTLLSTDYLNFSNKPKAILPFHHRDGHNITPIEEHLEETAFYTKKNKKTKLHFTISEEHLDGFKKIISQKDSFDITFSYQKQHTDTIAINPDNTLFRDKNDALVFRPGGHGALIENLNNLDCDIIFIKNIDNISNNYIDDVLENKKLLGGILIDTQNQVFEYIKTLLKNKVTDSEFLKIEEFLIQKLNRSLPTNYNKLEALKKTETLHQILNRPIRICGMVKNEGEPGGGPFWVKDKNHNLSLQIVESSQIDLTDNHQLNILKNATHFNPVDLVCGIKNYKGEKFNLNNFIDINTGFIVDKNKDGKPLKGYELPGLWNGAMAYWTTIFVEVPLTTFNPVKTVNDLLKPAHQPKNE